MHESSKEFEVRPDRTTDGEVRCPLASEKKSLYTNKGENGVANFSQLFLIGSFLYLHVTMTYISARLSSKFGQILPVATELAVLKRKKIEVATFSRLLFIRSILNVGIQDIYNI